jgi:mRNA-degrading endonuclease RelE of RelBE toxin-antitoxin system
MARQPKYDLIYAPEAIDHLAHIESKYDRVIRQAIEVQLSHTPQSETRNRKPLRQPAPFGSSWELRCGPMNRFRVFYRVDVEQQLVWIAAVGTKDRERLLFCGEEF